MKSIKGQDKLPSQTKTIEHKSFVSQLLSPATGLAILGTLAFICSFYRAGQLANLVIPTEQINQVKANASSLKNKVKLDINSQAVVEAADSSEAAMFAIAGDYKEAINQAIKDLTSNLPDNLPTILEAGDILSQFGNDKELAFGLLERALSMAPNNQYIALRYCQRLLNSGRLQEAQPKLQQLAQKYPQWADPHIVLSKLDFMQNKIPQATTELIQLTTTKNLNSRQKEQIALMLAKLGRYGDAFSIFQEAASGDPQKSFYSAYCHDWLTKNPDAYNTVLAMVKSNLIENKNSTNVAKQIGLEIKHASLLLLLGRAAEAQAALSQAINTHPNNFDLEILLATSYVALGQTEKAKIAFRNATENYEPTL